MQSPHKFCDQPDDGRFTRPKHVVVSYILLLSKLLCSLTEYIYIYIHVYIYIYILYALCYCPNTTGMTHLKILTGF